MAFYQGGRGDAAGGFEGREGEAESHRGWARRLGRWVEDRFLRGLHDHRGPMSEEVFHDLVQNLAAAADRHAVGPALIAAARRLIGSNAVDFVASVDGRPAPEAVAVLEVRRDDGVWGWLVVGEAVSLPLIVHRRLETLGAVAASVLDRLSGGSILDEARAPLNPDAPDGSDGARRSDSFDRVAEDSDLGFYPSAPAVHDATFLNAVFPFALSQARRHGESLTVLCAAIDRLGGIRELLGPDQVDRTVRHTGVKIATLIRSSDIVARLDDDRIMVLLPRARLADGLAVARKLCRGIADNAGLLSDAPMLSLSVGVASYPECAADLYELLDAADAALSEAQNQGRDRVAPAPALALERDPRRAPCAV